MNVFRILLILTLFWSHLALAQWKAPVYSNAIFQLGADARGQGTGGAEVATTQDASAFYWNPAGLTRISTKTQLLAGLGFFSPVESRQQLASVAAKVDSLRFIGFSFLRFSIVNQPFTGDFSNEGSLDLNKYSTFTSQHQALVFTAARKNFLREGISAGFNFKLLYQRIGSYGNGWGFGLDAGAQYTWKEWQLGLMIRDILPTFNAWSYNPSEMQSGFGETSNVLPERAVEITLPSIHPGIARRFVFVGGKLGVQPSVQLPIFMDGDRNSILQAGRFSIMPALGLRIDLWKHFHLCSGLGEMEKNQGQRLSLGAGIRWKSVMFDYAFSRFSSSGNPATRNFFSLKLDF